ncbi:MAG: sigma-70 family RNA polymerase sigma factor [Nitrospirae bacterium]|nr:sigma-70 family RNA polymerase sigma factor [Nitrospirota bacterium]
MHSDEGAIIRSCIEGNSEIYAILVDRYKEMIYNIAYRMVGDLEAANDIAQESFISAYSALKDFKGTAKFSSWLCSIALNKCRDHLKRLKPYVALDEIADTVPCSYGMNPEGELLRKQLADRIQEALNALPDEYREAIILKHMEGLDYKEMEALLNVRADTLKVRTHRARDMMKKLLGQWCAHD